MCRRSEKDPLVRLLTDRYRLNILRVPRAGIDVGDLLVDDSGDLRYMGEFSRFFDPPLELPELEEEALAPLNGESSKAISVKVAANPMATFLTALGLSGITSLSAKLQAAQNVNVTFQISGATLESLDVVELGNELAGRVLRTDNALYRTDRKFFVAHSVARATGLSLGFQTKSDTGAELAANIAQIAKASGAVRVKRHSAAQISVTGSTPLVFGLAVLRLTEEPGQLKLDLPTNLQPVRRQTSAAEGTPREVPSVLLGDMQGEFLLDIDDAE
jgi:hypothetical protein